MEDVMTVFNSPIEFAMRALMILDKTNVAMTARKLSLIDYMVTHIHVYTILIRRQKASMLTLLLDRVNGFPEQGHLMQVSEFSFPDL